MFRRPPQAAWLPEDPDVDQLLSLPFFGIHPRFHASFTPTDGTAKFQSLTASMLFGGDGPSIAIN